MDPGELQRLEQLRAAGMYLSDEVLNQALALLGEPRHGLPDPWPMARAWEHRAR